jgi:hypothetical protein
MSQALDAVIIRSNLFENLENAGALRCKYRFPACCGCDICTQGSWLQVSILKISFMDYEWTPEF